MFITLLYIHIILGGIALLSGLVNLIRKKGGKLHQLIGNTFVFAMLGASFSALILAILHPNPFLLSVGVLSAYFTYSGKRFLHRYTLKWYDYIVLLLIDITALYLAITAYTMLTSGNYFGIVLLFFSILLWVATIEELQWNKKQIIDKKQLIQIHIQRIIGAYIASFTAFLVVNAQWLPFIPATLLWFIPTLILSPYIGYWRRKYSSSIQQKNP